MPLMFEEYGCWLQWYGSDVFWYFWAYLKIGNIIICPPVDFEMAHLWTKILRMARVGTENCLGNLSDGSYPMIGQKCCARASWSNGAANSPINLRLRVECVLGRILNMENGWTYGESYQLMEDFSWGVLQQFLGPNGPANFNVQMWGSLSHKDEKTPLRYIWMIFWWFSDGKLEFPPMETSQRVSFGHFGFPSGL